MSAIQVKFLLFFREVFDIFTKGNEHKNSSNESQTRSKISPIDPLIKLFKIHDALLVRISAKNKYSIEYKSRYVNSNKVGATIAPKNRPAATSVQKAAYKRSASLENNILFTKISLSGFCLVVNHEYV